MKRSLVASDDLRDLVRHLPPALKRKIKQAIEEIVADPSSGKMLQEDLTGLSSYRVGNMRIIYRTEERSVHLVIIGPRKTVYQQAALELKRGFLR